LTIHHSSLTFQTTKSILSNEGQLVEHGDLLSELKRVQ